MSDSNLKETFYRKFQHDVACTTLSPNSPSRLLTTRAQPSKPKSPLSPKQHLQAASATRP